MRGDRERFQLENEYKQVSIGNSPSPCTGITEYFSIIKV